MPDKTLDELGQEVLAAVVAKHDLQCVYCATDLLTSGEISAAIAKMEELFRAEEGAGLAYYAAHKAAKTKSEGSATDDDEPTQDKA